MRTIVNRCAQLFKMGRPDGAGGGQLLSELQIIAAVRQTHVIEKILTRPPSVASKRPSITRTALKASIDGPGHPVVWGKVAFERTKLGPSMG